MHGLKTKFKLAMLKEPSMLRFDCILHLTLSAFAHWLYTDILGAQVSNTGSYWSACSFFEDKTIIKHLKVEKMGNTFSKADTSGRIEFIH